MQALKQLDNNLQQFGGWPTVAPNTAGFSRAQGRFKLAQQAKSPKPASKLQHDNAEKQKYAEMLRAQMEALAAAEETTKYPLNIQPDDGPDYPRQSAAKVDTYGRRPLDDFIRFPPVVVVPPRDWEMGRLKLFENLQNYRQQVDDLRQQVVRLMRGDPEDEVPETREQANVRVARTKLIITETNRDKKLKMKLSPEEIDAIHQQVEAKIRADRNSSDNDVYQRNRAMLQHLMRRQRYSKRAYKQLAQFWALLGISGDLLTFTGQFFDRDYLDTKSDRYYKYISILAFMLKYQRLSKVHAKLWFKEAKEQDSDEYFFGLWRQGSSSRVPEV